MADVEHRLQENLGAERSGFALLEVNEAALRWRLALIDASRSSLDVMTFLWWGDEAGELVLQHVLAAADRGVKVRLIVDDMTTIDDGKIFRLRDAFNSGIDAHPNIELRVFNPWANRRAVGRAVELVSDFTRLNQRMHNKALIADNRAAIMGGRNLGNEYMGLSSEFNFHDVDVLTVGHAARQVSTVFDRYWNSDWVQGQTTLDESGTAETLAEARRSLLNQNGAVKTLERFPVGVQDWSTLLGTLDGELHLGTSRLISDVPDQTGVTHLLPAVVQGLWAKAEHEVLIANPYVIPDEAKFERTGREVKPGVRFAVLTNSLASTDSSGVHAHYAEWRARMVKAGVELYELRHDAALHVVATDTPPVTSGFVGLHAKVMVIDRREVLVGSLNLDPRSWFHNSEMAMLIDCPALGEDVARVIERDLKPENAWKIEVDDAGEVRWVAGDAIRTEAPVREAGQSESLIDRLLPADLF